MLQKSSLLRNQPESLKQRIFRFFHLVIKHYSIHTNIYYALLVIEIIQICNYGVHVSFGQLWNTPIFNVLRIVLKYSDLSPLWVNSNIGLLVFAVLCLLINCASLVLILYDTNKKIEQYKQENQQNMSIVKYIGFFGIILQKILLIPMVLAFSTFIQADTYRLTLSLQIVLAVVSILGFITLFMLMALFLLFYKDNSPFSKLPFASAVNYETQILSLIKIALGIYGSIYASSVNSSMKSLIICIVYMNSLAFLFYHIHTNPGKIQYPFNRIAELCPLMGIWFGICSVLELYFSPIDKLGFYLLMIGIFLLPFACSVLNSKKVQDLLTANYKSIDTIEKYLIYNYECIRLANNNGDIMNIQMLEGIINYHISQCKKLPQLCFCGKIRKELLHFKLDLEKEDLQRERHLLFEFIQINLEEIKEKYSKSPDIRFLLSYIYQEILHNKFKSLHSLEQAREIQGGYRFQFLEYHYLREIENKIFDADRLCNEKKPVDINRYYSFQMKFGKLQELMEISTYEYVRFWELLKSEKVSIEKIYNQGVKILARIQEIKKYFEDIIVINQNNIHCLILYSNFMKVIANNSEPYNRNRETIQNIKRSLAQNYKLNEEIEKQKYGDNAISGIIIISGERTNIGIIKYCNWKVGELIGYAPHQLVGQNINVLMPKFIGNMHDDVLRNYLELSRSEFDYVQRLVPMIDSRNFMVLARVLTKPFPSLINGLELIGIFNQVQEVSSSYMQQNPKYVLYRSDTGQVQALSQSCYQEYEYKINKIDQFNETSSELTFKTLFSGIKEADIVDNKLFKCKIVAKTEILSEKEYIPVQMKLRLNIFYFSVNLRLLCFYTAKESLATESRLSMTNESLKKDDLMISNFNGNDWEKPKEKNDLSSLMVENKASKEKFLYQVSKKDELINDEPFILKLLKIIAYVIFFAVVSLAIFYVILHSQSQEITDFTRLTKYSGETIEDIIGIVYSSRMMQMSNTMPNLGKFQDHQNNISVLVNQLQNSQFAIETIYIKYGTHNQAESKEWILLMNGEISSNQKALDVNVFDFVTSASSFKTATKNQTNFNPKIMSNFNNITPALVDMFKIHYSGLYEIIPQKINYDTKFSNLFHQRFSTNSKNIFLQMIIVVVLLAVILGVMIYLQKSVIKLVDNTIMLFGHMTRSQIQKQIDNCNNFLDLFYQDSYLIHLKKKQKKQGEQRDQYAIEEIKVKLKNESEENQDKNNLSSIKKLAETEPLNKKNVNKFKKTITKIQYLEKELHLRTQAQILVSQHENENDNENNMLRVHESTEDDANILEKLQQNEKNPFLNLILLNVLIIATMCSYFIIEFSINYQTLNKIYQNIDSIQLSYQNIYAIKKIRLYSVQTFIDNSKFKTYPLLKETANTIYQEVYQYQREFDLVNDNSDVQYPFEYHGVCNEANLALIISYSKLFPPNSFSSKECVQVLRGSLQESIRLSMVGFAQIFYNYSIQTTMSQAMITNYIQAMKAQKYIQAPFRWYISKLQQQINQRLSNKLKSLIILSIVFIVILLLKWLVIWKNNVKLLLIRIKSSRQILQFIPVRILLRNAKLTKEYEQYIGNLMN